MFEVKKLPEMQFSQFNEIDDNQNVSIAFLLKK